MSADALQDEYQRELLEKQSSKYVVLEISAGFLYGLHIYQSQNHR